MDSGLLAALGPGMMATRLEAGCGPSPLCVPPRNAYMIAISPRGLPTLISPLQSAADSLLDFVTGSTVPLAVTGLSRAGKTVFLTSLIHNLLSAAHNPNRMPLLRVVGERRLIGARIHGGGQGLPRFPYADNIDAMASEPWNWPQRTEDVSEIEIDLRFAPASVWGQLVGGLVGEPSSLRLKLIDYPGEWLLDLPLLEQSYAAWSRGTLARFRRGERAGIARDYLAFVADHRASEPASEETARRAFELYRDLLRRARDAHGLSFLQPGRFLCPGKLVEAPYLWFAPLELPDGAEMPAPGSLAELMAQRYDIYKAELVEKFYADHFRRYGRQIVLVDVLRALLAGPDAFEDTRLALEAILSSFRYGRRGILARLIGAAAIDKVMFAATKADHVPELQRDHLAALLRNMVALPALDVAGGNAGVEVEAIASVISTEEDTQEIDGQRVQLVVGRPVGADRQVKLFVGTIPIRPPRREAWNTPFLDVPVFEPPAIDPSPVEGIPHIRLDSALEFLLGDRLQ
jgi:predicted YcjX-like family ATPase